MNAFRFESLPALFGALFLFTAPIAYITFALRKHDRS
jgi:hypothetical protein